LADARAGSVWSSTWEEVRQVIAAGVTGVLAEPDERARTAAIGKVAERAERVARRVLEYALKGVRAAGEVRERAAAALHEAERRCAEAVEQQQRTQWLIAQRRAAAGQGPRAVRRAELQGELAAERRQAEQLAHARAEQLRRVQELRARHAADTVLAPLAERLATALGRAAEGAREKAAQLEAELMSDRAAGEQMTAQLRACAAEEAQIQTELRAASEQVTAAEVAAQRLRDQASEAKLELDGLIERLGLPAAGRARARAGAAPRELRALIRETDRQIERTFEETFAAAARNFSELVQDVFPGGSGSLRLVSEQRAPRPVLGGAPLPGDQAQRAGAEAAEAAAE